MLVRLPGEFVGAQVLSFAMGSRGQAMRVGCKVV
jgi:hypothetical protein